MIALNIVIPDDVNFDIADYPLSNILTSSYISGRWSSVPGPTSNKARFFAVEVTEEDAIHIILKLGNENVWKR